MHLTFYKSKIVVIFLLPLLLAMITSCSVTKRTSVKNYPQNKPFVYDSKINLIGDIAKDEKNRLSYELINYWDDSLKVKKSQQFGFLYKIKSPPVFDSNNINRSVTLMNAYLNSQGYYYAVFTNSLHIDTVKDQLQAKIYMNIQIGKNIKIDSVSFTMGDSNLQKLTMDHISTAFLKKGKPYTKQIINSEFDRLVGIYRENGYFKFTREDIYALVDTTKTSLLQLTLDPFKQAEIIAEAARLRKINPTWDINVLKKNNDDSSRLAKFHIGNIYYYPETKLSDVTDSLPHQNGFIESSFEQFTMRYKKGLFKVRPLKEHTYLPKGSLYNETNYFKSINALSRIGAWQQVDAKPIISGKDSLDIYFFLIPAVKYSYNVDLEASLNTAVIGLGNLWGISTNFGFFNKNVWKSAVQSVTTFRTGVELNLFRGSTDNTLQTFLVNLGHTYIFPKMIQPFKGWRALEKLEDKKSLFSINASYVDRKDFYLQRSLITNWGYEWTKNKKVWFYKPINVEIYLIDTLEGLRKLFITNPFLKSSFNSGKVISQTLAVTKNYTDKNNPYKSHYLRLGFEEAGTLIGLLGNVKDKFYRFFKVEAEYRQLVKMNKSELAYRVLTGIGYNYGKDSIQDITLPIFKQFSAGGPNSMRAWGLRQLGLGSSTLSDSDTTSNSYRDRFGDMRFEANVEYRFPLTTLAGVKIASAMYADIGNIWNIKNNPIDRAGTFDFSKFGKDLAIDIGTGIRVDFSFFLIRLDLAYRVKDPARQYNNGWMQGFSWYENRPNGLKVPNFALQLGIGLPF